MPDKPSTAQGYTREQVDLVRSACLYLATTLGDLTDDLVIIGGLVPSLLIDQETLPDGADAHAGTMDLDIGLTVAVLDEGRYRTLTERLRNAGFSPHVNPQGNLTRQRWKVGRSGEVTVDFLIPPSRDGDIGGRIRHIESDFAALITPGLSLAFRDMRQVHLSGRTIRGEVATRDIWVCGAGAFVVLKALAFNGRGERKDAYDLYYVLRNFGSGVSDVAQALRPLLDESEACEAVEILRRDFLAHDGLGPMRVAEFLYGEANDETQAAVVGFVESLLRELTA